MGRDRTRQAQQVLSQGSLRCVRVVKNSVGDIAEIKPSRRDGRTSTALREEGSPGETGYLDSERPEQYPRQDQGDSWTNEERAFCRDACGSGPDRLNGAAGACVDEG